MYTFGDGTNQTSPFLVKALEGKHITQVECGGHHIMLLTSKAMCSHGGMQNIVILVMATRKTGIASRYLSKDCVGIKEFRLKVVITIVQS